MFWQISKTLAEDRNIKMSVSEKKISLSAQFYKNNSIKALKNKQLKI